MSEFDIGWYFHCHKDKKKIYNQTYYHKHRNEILKQKKVYYEVKKMKKLMELEDKLDRMAKIIASNSKCIRRLRQGLNQAARMLVHNSQNIERICEGLEITGKQISETTDILNPKDTKVEMPEDKKKEIGMMFQ